MAMGYDAEVLHNLNDTPQIEGMQLILRGHHSMRVVSKATVSASDIVSRMRELVNATNDAELAAALGLGGNAPSNWRQRNSPPYAFCVDMAQDFGVSLDWLIFGRGPKHTGRAVQMAVAGDSDRGSNLSPSGCRITRFVGEWDASRPEAETIWLEQHLKRTVPEYAEWLADHPPAG